MQLYLQKQRKTVSIAISKIDRVLLAITHAKMTIKTSGTAQLLTMLSVVLSKSPSALLSKAMPHKVVKKRTLTLPRKMRKDAARCKTNILEGGADV